MKRSIVLAFLALSGTASFAATQMIADFDNQLLAAAAPVVGSQFMFSTVHSNSSAQSRNVGWWQDPTLQTAGSPDNRYNVSRVAGSSDPATGPVPSPNGTNAYELRWAFMGVADPADPLNGVQRSLNGYDTFLRCYYHSTATLRCPVIDTSKLLKIDIWTKESLRVCLIASEIDLTGYAVGTSGPTGGPFEAFGGLGDEALEAWPANGFGGYILPAGQWTTLTFDLTDTSKHSIRAFVTGNGIWQPTTPNRSTINSLAFTPLKDHGADVVVHEVYIDNVRLSDPVAPGVYGKVTLQDFAGDVTQKPVTIEIEDSGASIVQTETVNLASDGTYSFSTNLADGTYSVYAKASHWLRQKVGNVKIVGKTVEGVDFSLVNGDVDGDNVVTVFDYNALSDAFDTAPGDGSWNPEADLDGDDSVSVFDYNILSSNFDQSGD